MYSRSKHYVNSYTYQGGLKLMVKWTLKYNITLRIPDVERGRHTRRIWPVARSWAQLVQLLPAFVSRPQNPHYSHNSVYNTAQNILYIWSFKNELFFPSHGGKPEAARMGYDFARVWADRSACLSLIFCEFLVGESRLVVWYNAPIS